MFRCCSLETSHPRLLPQSPKVCSIHLCLFFCFAYRVIVTIFLNSIYMCYYAVMVFIFLAYFTLYNGLQFPIFKWAKSVRPNRPIQNMPPIIREMQIKTTVRYHFTRARMAIIRTGHLTTSGYTFFFQVHKKHSSEQSIC